MVAEDEAIVGHVLLSRMIVKGDGDSLRALGLGPVAVLPSRQRQGIGAALVEAALGEARSSGEQIVFVLGEPAYYGRFGFDAATAGAFDSPYAGEYFQALALVDLAPIDSGEASYAPAFNDLG